MTDRAALLMAGVRIIEDRNMLERRPHPRSPSRAKRRAARGFPQHTAWFPMHRAYQLPDGTLVMHPQMASDLRALASGAPR